MLEHRVSAARARQADAVVGSPRGGGAWSRLLPSALCLVTVLGVGSAWASAPGAQLSEPLSAEQLVSKMTAAFFTVQTLQATGTTRLVEQAGGQTKTSEMAFELKLRRPNRLYFRTWQEKGGFVVVWDGSIGWILAPHLAQYRKYEGVADLLHFLPVASSLLAMPGVPLSYVHNLVLPDPKVGIMQGVTRAEVQPPQDASTYSLVLSQQEGEVVTLSVGKEDFLVQGILFDVTELVRKRASEGGTPLPDDYKFTATVTFTDVKVNERIEESAFTFSPPADAELVTQFGLRPLTGKAAPDFTLSDLSGNPVTVSALRGGIVLLYFLTTSAPPCQAAMPYLEKLHQEFQAQGLTVLGVTDEEKTTVETFLKDHNVTFTILLDPKGVAGIPYRVTFIPRTFIIDREGKVAADFTGPQEESVLRAKLAELGIK